MSKFIIVQLTIIYLLFIGCKNQAEYASNQGKEPQAAKELSNDLATSSLENKVFYSMTMDVSVPFEGYSRSSPPGIDCNQTDKLDCTAEFSAGSKVQMTMPEQIYVPSLEKKGVYGGYWICNSQRIPSPLEGKETSIEVLMNENKKCGAYYFFK